MAIFCLLAVASLLAKDESCPLSTPEGRHLNLCSMAIFSLLAAASPLAKDEGCPTLSTPGSAEEGYLNLCPMESYFVLAAASPLAKDEGCPTLSTRGSAEEEHLNPCPQAIASYYLQAAASPLPKDEYYEGQSLSTPGSAAYSSCLLRSSTTDPMGSNASVTQLLHPRLHQPYRRALHVI